MQRAVFLTCSLAVLTMTGCGGGGGTASTAPSYSIALTSPSSQLPVNTAGLLPNIGGPYTATLYIRAQDSSGKPVPDKANAFSCNLEGLDTGALYYLDGKPEHEKEETVGTTTIKVPIGYPSIALDSTAGGASFHFHTTSNPGTATVRCAYTDPNNQIQSATFSISVGGPSSPSLQQVVFYPLVPGYLYARNWGQPTQASLRLSVSNAAGRPAPVPEVGVNNVRVRLLSQASGETAVLTGVSATGQAVRGQQIALPTAADGTAQFNVESGSVTGTLLLEAVADRFDNNVDNGIADPVYGYLSINVVDKAPEQTALSIVTEALPKATVGIPYAAALEASGGYPPYTWNLVAESLPDGLVLDRGVIRGTPSSTAKLGSYNFVVELRDNLPTVVRKNLKLVLE